MTTVCCVCGKSKNNNNWSYVTEDSDVIVSHGYCPICTDKALQEIREWSNSHSSIENAKAVA